MAIFLGQLSKSLKKGAPAGFQQSTLEPVTVVDGLCALGNLTHFIHAPSKSIRYQKRPRAPLARVVFSVKAVLCPENSTGNLHHRHHIRPRALFACVQCALCSHLPPCSPLILFREVKPPFSYIRGQKEPIWHQETHGFIPPLPLSSGGVMYQTTSFIFCPWHAYEVRQSLEWNRIESQF